MSKYFLSAYKKKLYEKENFTEDGKHFCWLLYLIFFHF